MSLSPETSPSCKHAEDPQSRRPSSGHHRLCHNMERALAGSHLGDSVRLLGISSRILQVILAGWKRALCSTVQTQSGQQP